MKTKMIIFGLLLFFGCKSLETASFDNYAFERTRQLQKETQQLIAKSNTAYTENTTEIGELSEKISELKTYELQRKNNTTTQQMWNTIDAENSGLLPTLLKQWEIQDTLSETFRKEAQKQLDEAFEILMHWEQQKK